MIPVQVGNRIVRTVDACQANAMARGTNVRVIRQRSTKAIVRLIIEPHALDYESPGSSFSQDSRTSTKREALFTASDAVPQGIGGQRVIYTHKPSFWFSPGALSGHPGSRGRAESAPTTTLRPSLLVKR